MTTNPQQTDPRRRYPALEAVQVLIDALRRRWCWVQTSRIALIWATYLAVITVILSLLAGAISLSETTRWVCVAMWLAGFSAGPLALALVLWRRQPTHIHLARLAEVRTPLTHNHLTNALQISRQPIWRQAFVRRIIDESAAAARNVDPRHVLSLRELRRPAYIGVAAIILGAALAALTWGTTRYGLTKLLHGDDLATSGNFRILTVSPGNCRVIKLRPVEIRAEFTGPRPPRRTELVLIAADTRASHPLTIAPTDRSASMTLLPRETAEYFVRIGDAVSDRFSLQVIDPSEVVQFALTSRYPDYLARPVQATPFQGGPIQRPQGTQLTLTARTRVPADKLVFELRSGQAIPLQAQGGSQLTAAIPLAENDAYRLAGTFFGSSLSWPTDGGYWPITALPDKPPTIKLIEPGPTSQASAGTTVRFLVRFEDDHGLAQVRAAGRLPNGEPQTWHAKDLPAGTVKHLVPFSWPVPASLQPGQAVTFWFQATDNRRLPAKGPQTTVSDHYRIEIVSEAAQRRADRQAQDVLERIAAILRQQVHARAETVRTKSATDRPAAKTGLAEIARQQRRIHQDTAHVANMPFPQALAQAKELLATLAENETARARDVADLLVQSDPPEMDDLIELLTVQERIIRVLESILRLSQSQLAQNDEAEAAGADPTKDTFADLAELLGKFIDAERQAIRETSNLIQTDPDDFSETDLAKLEELKQQQEKWDKFLQQALDDLDKQIAQDFSASLAREELVEIQSQVKLAADALTKQATLVAVTAEQVGLELAEELVHNIEKWLPDEADRLKWELEEPPGPIDVPLAELPEELEDLIGELIEEEEDLYDEIEDVTSTWADSLDLGAGWAAMDGPISNYSAKGVTGNTLPNKNEIWGRSGQGRTGRSSGELVEGLATEKGGRRTPTRLTADAFQPGQIRDETTDPGGGATGGGKLSGASGEGLTGPGPKNRLPDLPALKNKQAVLLTKTKMVHQQAIKKNWGNFRLDETIKLMRANLADIDRRAYRSVLARKKILLGSMENSKTLLAARFQLDRQTQRLPKLLKKHTQNNDDRTWPKDHATVIERYYEILGQTGE